MNPPTGGDRELRDRVARLEIELAAAKRLDVESAAAKNFTVERMNTREGFFDRHGSLGVMFAIFLQTLGIVWWASSLTEQVSTLHDLSVERDKVISQMADNIRLNSDRLTRVQSVQENVVKILDRMQGIPVPSSRGPSVRQ
jgi:hypothetical protein